MSRDRAPTFVGRVLRRLGRIVSVAALFGAGGGLAGAVCGLLGGLLWGVEHGTVESGLVPPILYLALAGAGAGALVGGFGTLWGGAGFEERTGTPTPPAEP